MSSKKKPAAKSATKKSAAKKPVAKKPVAKKSAPEKTPLQANVKVALKKSGAARRPEPKSKVSLEIKKPAQNAGKPVNKSAGAISSVKLTLSNSGTPAKTTAPKVSLNVKTDKKEILKKVVETLKEAVAKPAQKKDKDKAAEHVRASASIYFSIADLNAYLQNKKNPSLGDSKKSPESRDGKAAAKRDAAPKEVAFTMPTMQKRTLGAASLADILGFNPVSESRAKFQEKDVPKKWKKYYRLLVELREKYSTGISEHVDDVKTRTSHDSAGDMNAYGQHLGDAGSESFERDLAFSLISDEKGTVAEIDAAIERMKNGTYGICEITKQPIPDGRLTAVPFTRYSKEGQEIKENETRKAKLAAKNLSSTEFPAETAPITQPAEDSDLPPALER